MRTLLRRRRPLRDVRNGARVSLRDLRPAGISQDEDLVILWAFGGAASIEQAGYVPLPDDEEKVQ